ncbi:MAG: hypothetical protein V1827_04735 [Candidatus Micrarchaeota archaeon]
MKKSDTKTETSSHKSRLGRAAVFGAFLLSSTPSCRGAREPMRKDPPPAVIAKDAPIKKADSRPQERKDREEAKTVREGDYMLHDDVLWNNTHFPLKVFRILEEGVEFLGEGDYSIHRPPQRFLVKYGERKLPGKFLQKASLEVRRGETPGTALLRLVFPPEHELEAVYERRIKKNVKSGDVLIQSEPVFDGSKRSALKVSRVNLWGAEFTWDFDKPVHPDPFWIRFGDERTQGRSIYGVRISVKAGKERWTADVDISYPWIGRP